VVLPISRRRCRAEGLGVRLIGWCCGLDGCVVASGLGDGVGLELGLGIRFGRRDWCGDGEDVWRGLCVGDIVVGGNWLGDDDCGVGVGCGLAVGCGLWVGGGLAVGSF